DPADPDVPGGRVDARTLVDHAEIDVPARGADGRLAVDFFDVDVTRGGGNLRRAEPAVRVEVGGAGLTLQTRAVRAVDANQHLRRADDADAESAEGDPPVVARHIDEDLLTARRPLAELDARFLDRGDGRVVISQRLHLDDGVGRVDSLDFHA